MSSFIQPVVAAERQDDIKTHLPPLRPFLIALEQSGDQLGAALLRALRSQSARPVEAFGIGGAAMANAGLPSLFPIDELSIVGFASIPMRLPLIVSRMIQTWRAIRLLRPDVLILVDSSTYNLPLARWVRRSMPDLPIACYVSPPVWAWRFNRARPMRKYIDRVLALLPFEPNEYAKRAGPACRYVGHPLVDQSASLRPSESDLRQRTSDPARLLVMPGSRRDEIERLVPIFGAAISKLQGRLPLEVVLPTFPHLRSRVEELTASWSTRPHIVTDPSEKQAAIRGSRAALTKSGTNTLELALAELPMVTAYRLSALEAMVLRRLVRAPAYTLPNLLLGRKLVPEFIHDDCTPDQLAAALLPLLSDSDARENQLAAFVELRAILSAAGGQPAAIAANEILDLVEQFGIRQDSHHPLRDPAALVRAPISIEHRL